MPSHRQFLIECNESKFHCAIYEFEYIAYFNFGSFFLVAFVSSQIFVKLNKNCVCLRTCCDERHIYSQLFLASVFKLLYVSVLNFSIYSFYIFFGQRQIHRTRFHHTIFFFFIFTQCIDNFP